MMAFRSKPSSFKIQLAEMSKRQQVQSSLNTFFGGKQDWESNTTPTTPAVAPIKETRIVERKVQMAPLWWKRKQNVLRVCREFPNGKNTHYSWGLEQITFKPRKLKGTRGPRGQWRSRYRHLQKRERTGKEKFVFLLFAKLRYSNERSTKFESLLFLCGLNSVLWPCIFLLFLQ